MTDQVGTEIPSIRKKVYQRALAGNFRADSIHNDEYTKKNGFRGALVSAYVLNGYISELLLQYYGPAWAENGEFSVSFINGGVQQGDEVLCRGVVTKVDGQYVDVDVWIERDDQTKVVVGHAHGYLQAEALSPA